MTEKTEEWRPGSFTKNFSWGSERGFAQLHESIRIGFDSRLEDVSRELFRQRLKGLGRPVYIPLNFFLFNRPRNGIDHIIVDELVFQAITAKAYSAFRQTGAFCVQFLICWSIQRGAAVPASSSPVGYRLYQGAIRASIGLGYTKSEC